MDATGSRTPRAGAASTPTTAMPVDETEAALGDLSGEALRDLIRRGHPLLFLPGPRFDEVTPVGAPEPVTVAER